MEFSEVKIEIYIPEQHIELLRNKLNEVHACHVGNYDQVISITKITGYFRPLQGSDPFTGTEGKISVEEECKFEVRCKKEHVKAAISVIKDVHPYETPVINIIPLLNELYEQSES